jgi:hypothetical protein
VGTGWPADEAWEAALGWLVPGPHRRRALAIAAALGGDAWLTFAHTAQKLGAREEVAAQLTEARIAAMTPEALFASGIDLALWGHRLDAAQAFSCWRRLWHDAGGHPRSRVMTRAWDDLIALAVRAGSPGCAEPLAAAMLDVADWFP